MKTKIINGKTLEEYNKKYKNCRHRLKKFTKQEVDDFNKENRSVKKEYLLEGRTWWLINDTYYEIPKPIGITWFRNLNAGVQVGVCLLGVGVLVSAIAVPLSLTNHKQQVLPEITAINITDTDSKKLDLITTKINEKVCIKILGNDSNNTNVSGLTECSSNSTKYTVNKNDDYFEIKGITTGEEEITFTYNQTIKTTLKVKVIDFYDIDWKNQKFDLLDDGNKKTLKGFAENATKIKFIKDSKIGVNKVGENENDLIYASFITEGQDKVLTIWSNKTISFEDNDTYSGGLQSGIFEYCSLVTEFDFSNIDVSRLTYFNSFFEYCTNIEKLDLSNFDTGNAKSFKRMFWSCNNLTSLDLSMFNTANATNMEEMFYKCYKLSSLDISTFNTANVTNMHYMFRECKNLVELNLSSFNTSKVTTMASMFYMCLKLSSLDLSNFDTSSVEDMKFMFYKCKGLNSLNISNFNTEKVKLMLNMFEDCISLTTLDLSSFDTSSVTEMNMMFLVNTGNTPKLTTIYASDKFVVSSKIDTPAMFSECINLKGGKGTEYDPSKIDGEYARIDDPDNSKPGYFTEKL